MIKNNKKAFLIYAVISVAIIWLPMILLKLPYHINDDYGMNNIADGSFMSNTMFLVFPNIIFGALLKVLYTVCPAINWMCIVYMAIFAASMFGLFLLVSKRNDPLLMIAAAAIGICLPFFLTFTVVAYIPIGVGVALMLENAHTGKNRKSIYAVSVIMIVTGYMLRGNTLISVLVLFAPFVVIMLISSRASRKSAVYAAAGAALLLICLYFGTSKIHFAKPVYVWIVLALLAAAGCLLGFRSGIYKELFTVLTVLTICILAVSLIDSTYETVMGYDTFREWTAARASVIDRPMVPYAEVKDQLMRLGITESDFELFRRWIFVDKSVFSTDVLKEMSLIFDKATGLISKKYIVKTLHDITADICILLPVLAALVLGLREKGKRRYLIFAVAVVLEVLFAALLIRQRFVARVYVPLLCIAIMEMLMLSSAAGSRKEKTSKLAYAVMIIICVLVCGHSYYKSIIKSEQYEQRADMREEEMDYIEKNSDKHYIVHVSLEGIASSNEPAIEVRKHPEYSMIIKSGGWDAFSPRYYDQMARMNIDDPDRLLCNLAERGDFRFMYDRVKDEDGSVIHDLEEYLKERTGISVAAEEEKRFESGAAVFKFTKVTEGEQ